MDTEMPGKVNITNTSENGKTYDWEVAGIFENGNRSVSESFSSEKNPTLYVASNSTIEITLYVNSGRIRTADSKQIIKIDNIPNKVTFGDLEITRIDLVNSDGWEWDDNDLVKYDKTYLTPDEYPDLLVNNEETVHQYEGRNAIWDVDIINGLPITLKTDNKEFESLSPQMHDHYFELVDFDGPRGSYMLEGGERIGVFYINPYHLTHEYNGGKEGNFPKKYKVKTDHFEGYLHMTWEQVPDQL